MKHRIKGKHLNRDTNNRKLLFKGLISSLIETGEIKTTETKAKAIKGLTDKLVGKAVQGSVAARRLLARFFGRRDVVNKLVDEVAPAMKDRKSGFTRITKIGKRRGDNTEMVKIEFVEKPVQSTKEAKGNDKVVKKGSKKMIDEAKSTKQKKK